MLRICYYLKVADEKEAWTQSLKDLTIDPGNPLGIRMQQFISFDYYIVIRKLESELVVKCASVLGQVILITIR
jgi:hypothetical protein